MLALPVDAKAGPGRSAHPGGLQRVGQQLEAGHVDFARQLAAKARPPARCLAAGRPGPGRRCGKLGQVVQRVGEMLGAERRELDAPVPDELRHR